jgi:diaminopimelate epimerase
MKLQFTKMHGAGNDFVVIDATREPFRPSRNFLARLADRHFGVGCDQVLVVEPPAVADIDFDYRIYNRDGSESGQCLNGSRAFARFVRDQGLSQRNPLRVRTLTSTLELLMLDSGEVRVNAGVPRLNPADVPFAAAQRAPRYALTVGGETVEIAAVSMGNPHAVLEVNDVESATVERLGAALQAHAAFPQQANVGFLQIVNRERARLRVNERGSGETLACGSGACAAAVAGRLWGKLGNKVAMDMRGGVLTIEWAGEGEPVFITGPVETVFKGELEWPN